MEKNKKVVAGSPTCLIPQPDVGECAQSAEYTRRERPPGDP